MAKKKQQSEKPKTRLQEAGFAHEVEEEVNVAGPAETKGTAYYQTDWPKPLKRYRLVYESYNASIEHVYFWLLNHTKQDQAYHTVYKLVDTFTAAENSSFWGYQQQRLGLQQDKVSQYLAVIGKMTKELFQVVREIRILKERLGHYEGSMAGKKAADTALKSYWVDLVEGAGKNPASVYGLAQQVGFSTLPDLFFDIMIKPGEDIDKKIEERAGNFNPKVKEVLRRKLQQYVRWRDETRKELISRHQFTIRYLRQHWNSIKLYMSWVKPYLKNIKRLGTDEKFREDPELISAMEGSIMEIEFLARRNAIGKGPFAVYPVLIEHFLFRTRPAMSYSQEYQRGPIHVGRVTVTIRAYAWTQAQIDSYIKYRTEEDIELLNYVDGSIEAAMEALGDDLKNYLREAEEEAGLKDEPESKEKPKPPQGPSMFEPFTALYGGFRDLAKMAVPIDLSHEKKEEGPDKSWLSAAGGTAKGTLWQLYKNYKKAHMLLAW